MEAHGLEESSEDSWPVKQLGETKVASLKRQGSFNLAKSFTLTKARGVFKYACQKMPPLHDQELALPGKAGGDDEQSDSASSYSQDSDWVTAASDNPILETRSSSCSSPWACDGSDMPHKKRNHYRASSAERNLTREERGVWPLPSPDPVSDSADELKPTRGDLSFLERERDQAEAALMAVLFPDSSTSEVSLATGHAPEPKTSLGKTGPEKVDKDGVEPPEQLDECRAPREPCNGAKLGQRPGITWPRS
jgi:hypothetical protein